MEKNNQRPKSREGHDRVTKLNILELLVLDNVAQGYTLFYKKLETASSSRSLLIFNPMLVAKVSSEFLIWNSTLTNYFSKNKYQHSYKNIKQWLVVI